jgi:hypothetical protein
VVLAQAQRIRPVVRLRRLNSRRQARPRCCCQGHSAASTDRQHCQHCQHGVDIAGHLDTPTRCTTGRSTALLTCRAPWFPPRRVPRRLGFKRCACRSWRRSWTKRSGAATTSGIAHGADSHATCAEPYIHATIQSSFHHCGDWQQCQCRRQRLRRRLWPRPQAQRCDWCRQAWTEHEQHIQDGLWKEEGRGGAVVGCVVCVGLARNDVVRHCCC